MLGSTVVPREFYRLSRIYLDSIWPCNLPTTTNCRPTSRNCTTYSSFFAKPPNRGVFQFKVHASAAETDRPKWWEKNVGPNMMDIHSTQEFVDALGQAGDRLVIVEFYGTWCASCRALFPKICRIAEQHPEILFLKVNFDENKPLCKSLNIKVLPCFHFYRGADGLLDSFSCSLAKLQKFKDAIATYNKSLCDDDGGAPSLLVPPEDKPYYN